MIFGRFRGSGSDRTETTIGLWGGEVEKKWESGSGGSAALDPPYEERCHGIGDTRKITPGQDGRSSGIAMIGALALLTLIGVALLATTQLLHRSGQRTALEDAHAQLRQLLTAGAQAAAHAAEQIDPGTGQPLTRWSMILPSEIEAPFAGDDAERWPGSAASVTLHTKTSGGGLIRTVVVEARYVGLTATQTLRYGKIRDGWGLLEVKTAPLPRPPVMPSSAARRQ